MYVKLNHLVVHQKPTQHNTVKHLSFILKKRAVLIQLGWLFLTCEGNGTPLQYSCLENPMDGGAW